MGCLYSDAEDPTRWTPTVARSSRLVCDWSLKCGPSLVEFGPMRRGVYSFLVVVEKSGVKYLISQRLVLEAFF